MTRFLAVAMSLGCMASFVACGGGGNEGGGGGGGNGGTEEGTLLIGVMNDDTEKATMMRLVTEYKKTHADQDIDILDMGSDIRQFLVYEMDGGTMPDVMFVQDTTVAYLASNEVLAPLDSYFTSSNVNKADIYQTMLDAASPLSDDKIYFAPRDYNQIVCYYNEDIFFQYDIAEPTANWTWDDFLSTCAQLRAKMPSNKYPVYASLESNAVFTSFVSSYGEQVFNSNNEFALTADSQALAAMKQLVTSNYAPAPSASTSGATFTEGNAAMIFESRPNFPTYAKAMDGAVNFVSFPAIGSTPKVGIGCSGYGIVDTSTRKNRAWDFINYVISADGQKVFAQTGSGIPVLKSLKNDTSWKNLTIAGIDLSEKNHDVFVANEERGVVGVSYLWGIKGDQQSNVIAKYNGANQFLQSMFLNTYVNDLAGCIAKFGPEFNAIARR